MSACLLFVLQVVSTTGRNHRQADSVLTFVNMTQIYDAALAAAVRRSLGTCLVIGGCGFMGSHIVSQLVQLVSAAIRPWF